MPRPAFRTLAPFLPAFVLAVAFALPPRASGQTPDDEVRTRSDKAHRELDCAAGRCADKDEPRAPARPKAKPKQVEQSEPPEKTKPVVRPEPVVQPEPPAKPKPVVKPEPKKKRAVPVTLYWHMADDADVYLNGAPLRQYTPSFKTRGDEAPWPAFSTAAVLSDGDVFTVGGRRGGSFGFMLVATDASGGIVFMTDEKAWKVYKPGEREDWFEPRTALASESGPVTVQPSPWYPQVELNKKHGNKAASIWSSPSETFAHLYGTVRLTADGERSKTEVSLRSLSHPDLLIRIRDSLAYLSDVEKEEAAFKKVPGLADPSAISFESAGRPGHFLRHQGGRMKLHQDSGDRLFKEDASFKTVPGLADGEAVSFESFNYPGHFIHSRDSDLFIDQGSDEQFRKDATFILVDAPAH